MSPGGSYPQWARKEVTPAKPTKVWVENIEQKACPKKPGLKINPRVTPVNPAHGLMVPGQGHQVGSAHQPAPDLSLPAQGVSATKVPPAPLHPPEPFSTAQQV